jgi:3'-5' exoribonuclease
MTHQFIKDVKKGMHIKQYFVVREVEELSTKEGSPYLRLVLGDQSGTITANIWSNMLQDCPGPFHVGGYVGAVGQVKAFRGALELKAQRILTTEQIIEIKGELKDFDVSFLHATTAYDPEQMWRELLTLIDEVLTPPLQDLVLQLMHRHAEAWQTEPAARRIHHAFLGGLLEHTWFVARLADQAARIYPDINRQLVVAGAILHDVGKIRELAQPYAPEYTVAGQLLGHIVLGWEMIRQEAAAINFPDQNLLLQLEHIVISHHGQRDFGSPVLPKTREAMVVYFADDLDAKLKIMEQHLQADNSAREFTPYHWLLQRELYKILPEPETAGEKVRGDDD